MSCGVFGTVVNDLLLDVIALKYALASVMMAAVGSLAPRKNRTAVFGYANCG